LVESTAIDILAPAVGVSLYPTYRKPFDVIFQRVKTGEWRALRDSNLSRFAGVSEAQPSASLQAKS
jgi:hypothetical protein